MNKNEQKFNEMKQKQKQKWTNEIMRNEQKLKVNDSTTNYRNPWFSMPLPDGKLFYL